MSMPLASSRKANPLLLTGQKDMPMMLLVSLLLVRRLLKEPRLRLIPLSLQSKLAPSMSLIPLSSPSPVLTRTTSTMPVPLLMKPDMSLRTGLTSLTKIGPRAERSSIRVRLSTLSRRAAMSATSKNLSNVLLLTLLFVLMVLRKLPLMPSSLSTKEF